MLEILALIFLCKRNRNSARMRGRSGGWAIAYTILLWFGMEVLGAVLGAALLYPDYGWAPYVFAILFAALGALISFLVAGRGPALYANPPQPQASAARLPSPCRVVILRHNNPAGAENAIHLTLNGLPIGVLYNNSHLESTTWVAQNRIWETDSYGNQALQPFYFDAPSGGVVELHYDVNRFLPELTRIIPGPGMAPVAPVTAPAPNMAATAPPPPPQGAPQREYTLTAVPPMPPPPPPLVPPGAPAGETPGPVSKAMATPQEVMSGFPLVDIPSAGPAEAKEPTAAERLLNMVPPPQSKEPGQPDEQAPAPAEPPPEQGEAPQK